MSIPWVHLPVHWALHFEDNVSRRRLIILTNFSTRPFYNQRGVYLALGSLAVAAILLVTLSVDRFSRLLQEEAALSEEGAIEQREVDRLKMEIQTLGTEMSGELKEQQTDAMREVNELLKRRAFSWTLFLNRIEDALPNEAVLSEIRPAMSNGNVEVEFGIVGGSDHIVTRFIESLEQNGGFEDMLPREEEVTEGGLHRTVLYGWYRPVSGETVLTGGRTTQERLQ